MSDNINSVIVKEIKLDIRNILINVPPFIFIDSAIKYSMNDVNKMYIDADVTA